jgi:hypothetical protein
VYSVADDKGRLSGFLVPTSGGVFRKVCESCGMSGWMSDSRRVMIQRRDGVNSASATRVLVLDTDTGTSDDVFSSPGVAGRPTPTRDGRWLSVSIGPNRVSIAPLRPGHPVAAVDAIPVPLPDAEIVDGRAAGWSPDGHLLYLLLGIDGFRCLYAQSFDPDRGVLIGKPFAVHHFHDPLRNWGSTSEGTAIIDRAFVFDQVELSGSIWLLDGLASH